jgi:CRISPR-associated exonuclease Cas4
MFDEDDYITISELQHFTFCRRQWALMFIEDQWADNWRTVDGTLVHENAHDENFTELRDNILTVRAMSVSSSRLGLTGQCDVVEFRRDDANGVPLSGKYADSGNWTPVPVEYKRGKPKENNADELQLCAQAICLEDMLCCEIPAAYLYYNELRRRQEVQLTQELRETVVKYAAEMRELKARNHTPKVRPGKFCKACSLIDVCVPTVNKRRSVREYIDEETT